MMNIDKSTACSSGVMAKVLSLWRSLSMYLATIMLCSTASLAQTGQVPVNPPAVGFNIDGGLKVNSALGDWVAGSTGTGGHIFESNGTVVPGLNARLIKEPYSSNSDIIFTEGSKFSSSPTEWAWTTGSALDKNDINNAMYLVTRDPNTGDMWIIVGGDRLSTNGTSYIDFELLQKSVTRNTKSNNFTSLGTDGGRTVNDITISVGYSGGGTTPTVTAYIWQPKAGGGFEYSTIPAASLQGKVFAATNAEVTDVPFMAFGSSQYQPSAFVEAAINITALIGTVNPCMGLNVDNIIIKTKASDVQTAALKDFVEPIPVELSFGTAEFSYVEPLCKRGTADVKFTTGSVQGGTFSASPSGLSIDSRTGQINLDASTSGVYTVKYDFLTNGCPRSVTATVTVADVPAVPEATVKQPTCGVSTGTIEVTAPIGQGLMYSIDGVQFQTGTTFSSLEAKTYTLTVRNSAGCTASVTKVINPQPATPALPTASGERCGPGAVTLTGGDAGAGNIYRWWATATAEEPLSTGATYTTPALEATTSYWVSNYNSTTTCESARVEVQAVLNPQPSVSVSIPAVCAGTSAMVTANVTSGTGPFTYTWSVPDGVTKPANNVASFTTTVPGNYSVIVKDSKGCSAESEVASPTFNPNPVANAGADQAKCSAGETTSFTMSGAAGNGTYRWAIVSGNAVIADPADLNTGVTVTGTGDVVLKLTTTSNADPACETKADEVKLSVNPPAALTAPTALIKCAGEEAVFMTTVSGTGASAGNVKWYKGTTLLSDDAKCKITVDGDKCIMTITGVAVSDAGMYKAILTEATCDSPVQTVSLTVNEGAQLSALTPVSVCVNEVDKVQFSTTVAGTGASAANVKWYKGAVMLSDDAKCKITVDGLKSTMTLTGVEMTDADTYKAVLADASCGSPETSALLTVYAAPATPALSEQVFCSSANATVNSLPQNGGVYTYYMAAEGGEALALTTPLTTGTYYVMATGVNCSSAKSAVKVTIVDKPDADAGEGKVLTCAVKQVQLSGSSSATAGIAYAWEATNGGHIVSGADTPTPTVDAAGTYTLTITTLKGGCVATDKVIVTQDESVPVVTISAAADPVLTCNVSAIELTGSTNIRNAMFSWTGPNEFTSDKEIITATVAGTYKLIVTNKDNGCAASKEFSVRENKGVDAEAGEAKLLNCSVTTVTLKGSTSVPEQYASIVWTATNGGHIVSDANTLTPTVDAAGTYTLSVKNLSNGCVKTDAVMVVEDIRTPDVQAQGGTLSCSTGTVQLMGSSSKGGVSYRWVGPGNFSSDVQNPVVSMAGDYTLFVTHPLSGCSASAVATVNPAPVVNIANPVQVCHSMGFDLEQKGLITTFKTGAGPVAIMGRKRNADGTWETANYAAMFDSQAPTGNDHDLYTTNWGKVLIINQDLSSVPNDNQWGGELILDFSAFGPVTMNSLKALDIDSYEGNSWVYLYDKDGNELNKVQLQNLGDNSKQDVALGNTKGVMKMKVVLDGRDASGGFAGSGAIDEIQFCVEADAKPACDEMSFNYEPNGLITTFKTGAGTVGIFGKKRNPDGSYAIENHAAMFDSQAPTGDDADLYTVDWGKVLIINQDLSSVPNDNQWGGELILDFSAFGPVTMNSLRALDIDSYEGDSWVYLYDKEDQELYKVQLQNLGNNSRQVVDLGNTKGVMKVRIVLDGRNEMNSLAGSGAFDDIRFCLEPVVVEECKDEVPPQQEEPVLTETEKPTVFPMPFADRTTIEFKTQRAENYEVNLYAANGALVRHLTKGTSRAKEVNSVEVDGRGLPNGLYFARILSGSEVKTVKLILKR
ncbi:T9SS type A sorting domain-containing protein [Pontibacter sp. MBLB2868]|uniref:Ig-like domain-containing protein n=1 Tax=Pontibacter sp. MBLB2868 TaxID=3451555 RepID=UPI003F74FA00